MSAQSTSLSKTKGADLPSSNRRNWLIHRHFVRREFETCLTLIKEQMEENGGMCEFPLYVQGLMLREKGQLQQSLQLLKRCRQLNPLGCENAKQIGRALFLLGEYQLALTMFGHAASMCSDHPDWNISYNKAICQLRLGDVPAATAEITDSLTGHQHARGYKLLAEVAGSHGDTETAIAVYQQATHSFPDDVDLIYSLGMLYLEKDRPDEALEQFGLALAYQPNHSDSLLAAGYLIQV